MTIILCFVIGFIYSRVRIRLAKYANNNGESENTAAENPTIYEDVLSQQTQPNDRDLELKENVAYASRVQRINPGIL